MALYSDIDAYANTVAKRKKQSSINNPYTQGATVATAQGRTAVSNADVESRISQTNKSSKPYTQPTTSRMLSIGTPRASSSAGIVDAVMPTIPTAVKPVMQPIITPEQNQSSQQQAYSFIGGPKQPTTPTQPQQTNQPTTQADGQTTPEAPAQDEWIGQSRTEEQSLQYNIDKTQEELMNLKNREDALGQAEFLKKTKELQEYQTKQKEITDKQKAMSEEQNQIQSSRKLQDAQKSLSQLKRNTAYLSSQGLGQSAGALDAFSQQISNAEGVFKEMVQYEQYAEEMRKLGYEFDANAYEKGMKDQQDELDKYVSDTIQTIFNNMSAAEMAGQMDTVDEVDAFAQKYFNSIDTDIANMTRKQIQIAEQKQALQVQQLAEVKKVVANKSVINKDMSTAQGYYVDGNGAPIISATTGSFIPLPQDPPMEPIRDAKTGKLVSFSLGEDGQIQADVQQVIDQPTFSSNTIQNMVQAVANGTMTVGQAMDVLPPDAQQQFLDKIGSVKPAGKSKEIKTIENPDGTKQSVIFDPETGSYTPVSTNYQTPSGVPIQDAIALAISKCATGAQCGKFVNDVLEAAGAPRLVKDSFESKVQAIQTIGEAYSMEDVGAGSIFTYPVSGSTYGHIGIVTAVNADGTLNIMDYNYNNDEQQRERTNVNANEILGKGGYLSRPIITDQTVASQEGGDESLQVFGLTQGLGGTEGERKQFQKNILQTAEKYGISLQEAKKKLGYKSGDDTEFAKNRKEQFTTIQKSNQAITKGKSALMLLDQPQTAVGDVASIVGFLKTIDPSSVARETEVDSVENARGLLDSISVKFAKLSTGKKLSADQRQELKDTIGIIVKAYENNMSDFIQSSSQEFDERGLDMSVYVPKDIISRYSQPTQQNTQQIQITPESRSKLQAAYDEL